MIIGVLIFTFIFFAAFRSGPNNTNKIVFDKVITDLPKIFGYVTNKNFEFMKKKIVDLRPTVEEIDDFWYNSTLNAQNGIIYIGSYSKEWQKHGFGIEIEDKNTIYFG